MRCVTELDVLKQEIVRGKNFRVKINLIIHWH